MKSGVPARWAGLARVGSGWDLFSLHLSTQMVTSIHSTSPVEVSHMNTYSTIRSTYPVLSTSRLSLFFNVVH